jgi:hypothetical protein
MLIKMRFILLFALFTSSFAVAQSPYRVFALDSNLKIDSERQTASIVTKAFILNKIEFINNNKEKLKPYNKIDFKKIQKTIDSLFAIIPKDSEYAWEEDYGLRLDGMPKHERWKELTYYYNDFDAAKGPKEIVNGKKKYILQVKILIDLNGQIEDIQIVRGNKMVNRDILIGRSYTILYRPKKATTKSN